MTACVHRAGVRPDDGADIAVRAGLQQRSYFRYFADKGKALFWGEAKRQESCVQTIVATPVSLT
jgi:hypothetical protein